MGISTRMIQELWINIRGRMTQKSWFMASYLEISKVYMWLGRTIKDLWINIRDGMTKESWLMIHDLLLRINREEEYNWELIGWCRNCESILEVEWLRNCDSCGSGLACRRSWIDGPLRRLLNLIWGWVLTPAEEWPSVHDFWNCSRQGWQTWQYVYTEIGKKAWLCAKLQPGRARKRINAT